MPTSTLKLPCTSQSINRSTLGCLVSSPPSSVPLNTSKRIRYCFQSLPFLKRSVSPTVDSVSYTGLQQRNLGRSISNRRIRCDDFPGNAHQGVRDEKTSSAMTNESQKKTTCIYAKSVCFLLARSTCHLALLRKKMAKKRREVWRKREKGDKNKN